MRCYTEICCCLFNRNCYFGRNIHRSILISVLVAEGNSDIYNGFKKTILTTSARGNRKDRGMVVRIRNMVVCYEFREKKQGPVVYLSLTDKIRKSYNDISVRDLNKDEGLDIPIRKIKSLYEKDTKRHDDMNVVGYMKEFEGLNNQIKHFHMELTTGVLAYKVLSISSLQVYQVKSSF